MKYIIGTRGSKLALIQAHYVYNRLAEAYPGEEFEVQVIKTKGDIILDKPLNQIGEKGVFVKEIEEKLLSHEIDIGVHSMKDMPSKPAPGLAFAKAWEREDPRDALILREKHSLTELPEGATIATGSKRREFQLKRLRPDLNVVGIRGNVDTRLRKMEEEKLDGILLAAAGLHRMGLQDRITQYFEADEIIPAPAQGILALEIQEGDEALLALLNALSDDEANHAAKAERGFLQKIGGDCHVPVGAVLRKLPDSIYQLDAMFGNETGSKLAFAAVRGTDPEALAQEVAVKIRKQMAGMVSLVGSGPGDPGLITRKGLLAIQEADCIIYDRLASPELLDEAKPGCEMIYVGKASHNHTMRQEEINSLLVQKSMEYAKTVRLKGGDVYVFGRGGEEGMFLQECGVPFEVIPGISSSIAGLAYAGIPATHRAVASGFHVLTAHDKNDQLAKIDFEAIARSRETCIFLMGLSKVGEIAEQLIAAGMAGNTKIAVISSATTPEQKTCVSDLEHIAEEVTLAGLPSPALIVIGDVIALRDSLNFYENLPLFGKRYLIPKIGSQVTRLKELLSRQGAAVDEIQIGNIVDLDIPYPPEEFMDADWFIFTSKNGVEAFFRYLQKNHLDIRSLGKCKVAAIGRQTAEVLQEHGLYADFVPEQFHSGALADGLKQYLAGNEKVCCWKAENADSCLKEALKDYCELIEIQAYENQAVHPDLDMLRNAGRLRMLFDYDAILLTCASSAERLIEITGEEIMACRAIYSIGPKTSACLKAHGIPNMQEAKSSTYEALAELCISSLS